MPMGMPMPCALVSFSLGWCLLSPSPIPSHGYMPLTLALWVREVCSRLNLKAQSIIPVKDFRKYHQLQFSSIHQQQLKKLHQKRLRRHCTGSERCKDYSINYIGNPRDCATNKSIKNNNLLHKEKEWKAIASGTRQQKKDHSYLICFIDNIFLQKTHQEYSRPETQRNCKLHYRHMNLTKT